MAYFRDVERCVETDDELDRRGVGRLVANLEVLRRVRGLRGSRRRAREYVRFRGQARRDRRRAEPTRHPTCPHRRPHPQEPRQPHGGGGHIRTRILGHGTGWAESRGAAQRPEALSPPVRSSRKVLRAPSLMPQADQLPGLDQEGHATRPFIRAQPKGEVPTSQGPCLRRRH